MISALDHLESAVLAHLGLPDARSVGPLAARVKALSDAFTKERDELPADYLADPGRRAAYVGCFLLLNAAKAMHALAAAFETLSLPPNRPLAILDLGSGPGSVTLAASLILAERFPDAAVRFTAVEQNADILSDARALFDRVAPKNHGLETIRAQIDPTNPGTAIGMNRFDLICAANLLNEFDDAATALVFTRALLADHLEREGRLLIIDPALRKTTRPLMALRDTLTGEGMKVIAPCLHQKSCPMLAANERDWCHFYCEWKRPPLIARIDALTGLDHRFLKMAYLILTRDPRPETRDRGHHNTLHRVVSSPIRSKGKIELVLCGSNGELRRVRRLDRDASETNAAFDRVRRGDIVALETNTTRIASNDTVAIAQAWTPPI